MGWDQFYRDLIALTLAILILLGVVFAVLKWGP